MKCRRFISSTASLLLSLWYLAAIVGFDTHIDHHDGEVFVVSMLCRTDCESLHPNDKCHCIDHHHGMCHEDDEDCENEVSLISLTGDGYNYDCDITPAFTFVTVMDTPTMEEQFHVVSYSLTFPVSPPRGHLRDLCVLRV